VDNPQSSPFLPNGYAHFTGSLSPFIRRRLPEIAEFGLLGDGGRLLDASGDEC
jgi:hypothetical protein